VVVETLADEVTRTVADCDRALELLRVLSRQGSVEERELAWLSIDEVLDRRNRLDEVRDVRYGGPIVAA
jgi:hypothetical protein